MLKERNYYTMMKNYLSLTEKEINQIMVISKNAFGEKDAAFIGEFMRKTPFKEANKVFMAFDVKTDHVIGFINLTDIPLNYYGVEMKSGELSIVATDPDYQNMGISNKLTEMFMDEVKKCAYTSIFIQGIPHFYRKYGFNYAIPMSTSTFDVKKENKFETSCALRKATVEDVAYLYEKSSDYSKNHDCIWRNIRPEIIRQAISEYKSGFLKRNYLIVEKNDTKMGYFYYTKEHDNLKIEGISEMNEEAYSTILKYMTKQSETEKIEISIPAEHSFYLFLKSTDEAFEIEKGDYSWQVKIPDYFLFFNQIKPILEKRINDSEFKDREITFKFNNFKDLIEFSIKDSKIELKKLPWGLTWDCNVPTQAFVKLVFDHFTYEDLKPVIPDLMIKEEFKDVFKVLFPAKTHHLNQGY